MPLTCYATMDPLMLLSIANMKLRDECDLLASRVARYDLERETLGGVP